MLNAISESSEIQIVLALEYGEVFLALELGFCKEILMQSVVAIVLLDVEVFGVDREGFPLGAIQLLRIGGLFEVAYKAPLHYYYRSSRLKPM